MEKERKGECSNSRPLKKSPFSPYFFGVPSLSASDKDTTRKGEGTSEGLLSSPPQFPPCFRVPFLPLDFHNQHFFSFPWKEKFGRMENKKREKMLFPPLFFIHPSLRCGESSMSPQDKKEQKQKKQYSRLLPKKMQNKRIFSPSINVRITIFFSWFLDGKPLSALPAPILSRLTQLSGSLLISNVSSTPSSLATSGRWTCRAENQKSVAVANIVLQTYGIIL